MRKVSFIFLIIISFLLMVNDVKAVDRDQIDYKIESFDINTSTGEVTVDGWAIIGGHNNYGGVLTNIKLQAKSASRTTVYTANLELKDTSLNYGSNINYTGNVYCFQRACTEALDANGNTSVDPITGNVWLKDEFSPPRWDYKGNCFYRNMYFRAKFSIDNLRNLGSGIYFNLIVSYDTKYDTIDKCSVNSSERATADNILNRIRNGEYVWGYSLSKSKNITVDENNCKVNGGKCESVNRVTIGTDTVDLKITNTGSVFRLNFDEDYEDTPLSERNVSKDLVCENNMFQSVTEERVYITVEATGSDQTRCPTPNYVQTVSAEYYVVQSGDLMFNLERGPVYSGGNFNFEINYTNSVRWYYGNDIQTCPATITVPHSVWETRTVEQTVCDSTGCHVETITEEGCFGSEEVAVNEGCSTVDGAKSLYEKQIPIDIYRNISEGDKFVTLPKDSNLVANSSDTEKVGEWVCDGQLDLNGQPIADTSRWTPGEEWVTKCKYTLPSAQLNVKTANVEYDKNHTSAEWINEGNTYYVPLKWPTGSFPIRAEIPNLSSVSRVNWNANYECDVEVKQMLYDLDNGGFYFFYRPIILSNPFPDREPSKNWQEWWSNSDNKTLLANSYNNLEYTLNLSPSALRDIKVYNMDKVQNTGKLGYLDHSINPNGTSNFFAQVYVSTGFNRNTSDYARLGEMN